jgi:hypothetical protein
MNKTEQILSILQEAIYYSENDVEVRKPLVDLARELSSLFADVYEKEFVIAILTVINEGYYRPEYLDELYQNWQKEIKK